MRILSNFKDYYDGVMAMDGDRKTIYVRDTVEVPDPIKDKLIPPLLHGYNRSYYYTYYKDTWTYQVVVGFCGKVYLALKQGLEDDPLFFSAREFFDGHNPGRFYRTPRKSDYYFLNGIDKDIENYYNTKVDLSSVFDVAPVFYFEYRWHSNKLVYMAYNPPLYKIGFQRILPPYQAYQELSMWMNNLAVPNKPMPKIDDETMQSIKGFEHKYSFRKEPDKCK